MKDVKKCPFHNDAPADSEVGKLIAQLTTQFKAGVDVRINTPESQQALYAYRIFQLGDAIGAISRYMDGIIEDLDFTSMSYLQSTEEIKEHFVKICTRIFMKNEHRQEVVQRLRDGLNTFHAFMKRAVIVSKVRDEKIDFKGMSQFASTSIERLNVLALDPYKGWEGLFFDPDIDVSQLLKGMPINRPIYKCPILYSGKFRVLAEYYYTLLTNAWELSNDSPKNLSYFS